MRVHLEYAHTLDPAAWAERHAAGLVPDRLPYGLDRLEHHGCGVSVAQPLHGAAAKLDAASRLLTGGLSVVGGVRAQRARRAADVVICWDMRSGAAAALRSRLPGEPPAVVGVIWLTEPTATETVLGRALARGALSSAAAVWAMSSAQLEPLRTRWHVDPRRLHKLDFGIDTDFWTPGDSQPEPDIVLSAGNDRHRDHALLVDALASLRRRRRFRFELVSHHPVAVPPELGVRHEDIDHRGMRDAYARCSIVALALKPNLHVSGLSVLLEAMASARPVVVSDTPGMRDYVEDGVNGILVPPGDVQALADAVESLLDDPDRAREIGRTARAVATERFSTERQANDLAQIAAIATARG